MAPACLFRPWLGNPLVMDDHLRIARNPAVLTLQPVARYFLDPATSATEASLVAYRPLLPLTLAWTQSLGGGQVWVHRLANMLLHGLNACLVLLLGLRLLADAGRGEDPAPAYAAAAVFAVHPVTAFAANYLCSRDLLLATGFTLGCLLAHCQERRPLAVVLMAVGLGAKESAAVAPALVALHLLLLRRVAPTRAEFWRAVLPLAAVIPAYLVWVHLVVRVDMVKIFRGPHGWSYPLLQLEVHLTHYLRNLVDPRTLCFMPRVEPFAGLRPAMVAGALVLMATVAYTLDRRRPPLARFGLLAYLVTLAPTSSVLPMMQAAAHYRPYLGLPFLLLALASLVPWRGRGARGLVAAVLVAGVLGSGWLLEEHSEPRRLWYHATRVGAEAHAYEQLGLLTDDLGERARLYARGVALAPGWSNLRVEYGAVLLVLGEVPAAAAQLAAATQLDPSTPDAWLLLSLATTGATRDQARRRAEAAGLRENRATHAMLHDVAVLALRARRTRLAAMLVEELGRLAPRMPHLDQMRAALGHPQAPPGAGPSVPVQGLEGVGPGIR